jgi:hypothetical protein
MLNWLKKLPPSDVKAIVNKLNVNGRVTDACGTGIGSKVVESWTHECTEFLQENGYEGGSLTITTEKADDKSILYILQS